MPRHAHLITPPQINEALELALEAIDREGTTKPMDKEQKQEQLEGKVDQPKENQEQDQEQEQEEEQEQEQVKEEKKEQELQKEKEETCNNNVGKTAHTEGGEIPNKTDEQKRQEEENREREPIYENVSSTISMHEVDNEQIATQTQTPTQTPATRRSHRRSIPNKQTSNNSHNNENNQSPNQSNNSNINNGNGNQKSSNISNQSEAVAAAMDPTTPPAPGDSEPYYQVPKVTEPYYDAPKHLRPVPVYENIEIFYTGLEISQVSGVAAPPLPMEPPKEKPPPPPTESPPPVPHDEGHDDELDGLGSSLGHNTDTWSSDNTYETISNGTRRQLQSGALVDPAQPSPPIKRMNSTKRIKKELRNKRSSFLGIETDGDLDDMESYLELTVAPPPDMAQLLQEERRLEKQLYIKAGLCDSSDTGE